MTEQERRLNVRAAARAEKRAAFLMNDAIQLEEIGLVAQASICRECAESLANMARTITTVLDTTS